MFVFFFKQKTAYEMRISDWSSDVCSSDLEAAHAGGLVARLASDQARVRRLRPAHRDARRPVRMAPGDRGDGFARRGPPGGENLEIGRASCRERVGQYV